MGEDQPMQDAAQPEESNAALDQLRNGRKILDKSVAFKDLRLAGRALRMALSSRKDLNKEAVATVITEWVDDNDARKQMLQAIGAEEETGDPNRRKDAGPEVATLAALMVTAYFIDAGQFDMARTISARAVERAAACNRRTLDAMKARLLQMCSLATERSGELSSIRDWLMQLYRSAVLQHDAPGQETLINLILRNFLHYRLYDQAEQFRSKVQRPDAVSNQQVCRYLFYLGRIRAVHLEYSEAKECLAQALRKVPNVAKGFRLATTKWLSVVRLLLGEIPERHIFVAPGMRKALRPYYDIANAVRLGNLQAFKAAEERHARTFHMEGLANLVSRLHRNVVRAGLRKINLAYSKISLPEVASKVGLGSHEDAEFVLAKAIKDGALDATIDPSGSYLTSHSAPEVYSTTEPASAFHARIAYCLNLHNDAVQAMQFPDSRKGPTGESPEQRRERLLQEEEILHMADDEEFF